MSELVAVHTTRLEMEMEKRAEASGSGSSQQFPDSEHVEIAGQIPEPTIYSLDSNQELELIAVLPADLGGEEDMTYTVGEHEIIQLSDLRMQESVSVNEYQPSSNHSVEEPQTITLYSADNEDEGNATNTSCSNIAPSKEITQATEVRNSDQNQQRVVEVIASQETADSSQSQITEVSDSINNRSLTADESIHEVDRGETLTVLQTNSEQLEDDAETSGAAVTDAENTPQENSLAHVQSFVQARIIHIIPPAQFLQQKEEGSVCPSCGRHLPKRQSLDDHLLQHLDDSQPSEVIITDQEHDRVHSKKVKIRSFGNCTPHFFHLRFNCPDEKCRHAIYKRHYFEKLKFLKQHYLKMHAEKVFTCDKCSAGFSTISLRDAHCRMCGILFKCNSCDKLYKEYSTLQTHARRRNHIFNEGLYKQLIESIKEFTKANKPEVISPAPSIQIQMVDGTFQEVHLPSAFAPQSLPAFSYVQESTIAGAEKMNAKASPSCSHQDINNNAESTKKKITVIDLTLDEDEENGQNTGHQNGEIPSPSTGTHSNGSGGKGAESGKKRTEVRQGNRTGRKMSNASKQRPGYPDLVKILPKPVIHATRTESEAQTDAAPKGSGLKPNTSTAVKRRHSAATQTHPHTHTKPPRVSKDTQTPNKRRRLLKNSTSTETQTTSSAEPGGNLESAVVPSGSTVGRIDATQPDEVCAPNASVEDLGMEVPIYHEAVDGNETFGFGGWTQQEQLLPLPDAQQTNAREISVPATANSGENQEPSSGLSGVLFTDMSTSPMHFPEELSLFPDLLGAETQTDFIMEKENEIENADALDFTSSETQTHECSPDSEVLATDSDPAVDIHDFSFEYFDATDGQTQTH